MVESGAQGASTARAGTQSIAELFGKRRGRNVSTAPLEYALPFFGDITAVVARSRRRQVLLQSRPLLRRVARRAPQHYTPYLLRAGDRQLGGQERAELIAEDIDGAHPQAIQEIPDRRGELRHRSLRTGGIGRPVARQVRRIDAAVVTQLAQHRAEQPPRAAGVMQADDGYPFVEAAAGRISGPQMNLAEAAVGVRAADVNYGGLRQRQTGAMLGLDHFGRPWSLIVRRVYGAVS